MAVPCRRPRAFALAGATLLVQNTSRVQRGNRAVKRARRAAQAGILTLVVTGFGAAPSAGATITTFDPPGSVDTYPYGINASGSVTGYYRDAGGEYHGFLRTADGTITSFDVPGTNFTYPRNINNVGAITGSYQGSSNYEGFVRAPDGTITTFAAFGDSTEPV